MDQFSGPKTGPCASRNTHTLQRLPEARSRIEVGFEAVTDHGELEQG
jgi:hypothetical protein